SQITVLVLFCHFLIAVYNSKWKEVEVIPNKEVLSRMKGTIHFDDERLLSVIREKYIMPPSTARYKLRFNESERDGFGYRLYEGEFSYQWCTKIIKSLFFNMKNAGFFVEAGALDGEFLSNTLYLETQLSWTGLLVESDGDSYRELLKKNRRAWSSHSCLATKPYPYHGILAKYPYSGNTLTGNVYMAKSHGALTEVHENFQSSMQQREILGMISKNEDGKVSSYIPGISVILNHAEDPQLYESVQCLPLGSLLLALNVTHVDFVSLDVEMAEVGVLEYFPWDNINVDVWLVEHNDRRDNYAKAEFSQAFVDKFVKKGYILYDVSSELIKK
ncbi:unnamed protein product, partial [Meganyctiphanes norvegica]